MEVTGQKRELFDGFAREADSAKVYDAKDVTEIKVAKNIIEMERERLDIVSNKPVSISNPTTRAPGLVNFEGQASV